MNNPLTHFCISLLSLSLSVGLYSNGAPDVACRVICKLLASKSESIRVQALKVLGYFLKHLGHKSVSQHALL